MSMTAAARTCGMMGLALFLLAGAGPEPEGPLVTSLLLAGRADRGCAALWLLVQCMPPNAGEPPADNFQVTRVSHTGETTHAALQPAQRTRLGATFLLHWRDENVIPGGAYRYRVDYSWQVQLCSNEAVVLIPADEPAPAAPPPPAVKPQTVPPPETPLSVEVRGEFLAVPDQPLLVTAVPSRPCKTYQWECISGSAGSVLMSRGRHALVAPHVTGNLAVFQVTCSDNRESAVGYFRPDCVDLEMVGAFSYRPDTAADIERRARRKVEQAAYEDRLRAPEAAEELRLLIRIAYLNSKEKSPVPEFLLEEAISPKYFLRGMIERVGKPALIELRAAYDRSADLRLHSELLSAMRAMDEEYVYTTLYAGFLESEDVAHMLLIDFPRNRDPRLMQICLKGLASRVDFVRMALCRHLAQDGIVEALPALEKLAAQDPSPQVRFWATTAVHYLKAPQPKRNRRGSPAEGPALPEFYLKATPDVLDPEDIPLARAAYAELRKILGTTATTSAEKEAAYNRFRLFGAAALPVLNERLSAADCDKSERGTAGSIIRALGGSIPRAVTESHIRRIESAPREARAALFADYKQLLAESGLAWGVFWTQDSWERQRVSQGLAGPWPDQVETLANLSLATDKLADSQTLEIVRKARIQVMRGYLSKIALRGDRLSELAADLLAPQVAQLQ